MKEYQKEAILSFSNFYPVRHLSKQIDSFTHNTIKVLEKIHGAMLVNSTYQREGSV